MSTSEINFDAKEFINAGSLGAFNIGSIFSNSSIYSIVKSNKVTEQPSSDFSCKGGHYEENYMYEFPKNLKILAVPDNISFKNALVSYQATFGLKDNTLTVMRKYDDVTSGPVCDPEVYKAYKELAIKVMPNLKSQVVYKYI